MHVQQISVFIENKSGRLAEVTRLLGARKVGIRALTLADTSDFGILRLLVDDTDLALATLREGGFTVRRTDVVAVEVPDRPGGLNDLLQQIDAAGLNIEYMYAFGERHADKAVIIFRFDDIAGAIAALQARGVNVLPGASLSPL